MAEREIERWITTHSGNRIPIFKGESVKDAINRVTAKRNEDIKQKQIKQNKEQADKLNNKNTLPRRLSLPDISADDANKTSDVLNLRTKRRFRFKDGTKITNVIVFAGKGCSKELEIAPKCAEKWGGKAEDWQHCAGTARLTDGRNVFTREVHWVQQEGGDVHDAFIKEYPRNLERRR